MGHLNFGEMQGLDKKGLLHFGTTDRTEFKWKAYRIHLNNTDLLDWQGIETKQDEKAGYPKLLNGTFSLTRVGDTYFNLSPFIKGYIWVNGHLLGRYWNIGPQHSLFCPGVWLK
jgi:beta-galactosidase